MRVTNRSIGLLLAALISSATWISPASAQSVSRMLDECSSVGKGYFREPAARTEMKYNGQRADGTHAINGRIFLETRFEDFACSYARNGQRMVQFVAQGRAQNAYLPGAGNSGADSSLARVTGISANDVLNVRSGPGTNYAVVGALANGEQVRNLRCENRGSSRWCEIEMMTDMRERGWVNARYLSSGAATQLPSKPPSAEAGGTRTVRVKFEPGRTGTELREQIPPGGTIRFVLNARNGQFLYTRVAGDDLTYQIMMPNGRFLLNQISSAREYRGQLFTSGDHVIEVINRTSATRSFNIIIGIQ